MTEFTDEILTNELEVDIITETGIEILLNTIPSGNLKVVLTSGTPPASERGIAARHYTTGQIEITDDGGFVIMTDNYEAGDVFAAATTNGTAVYQIPNYNGIGFSRTQNVYVELRDPASPFESTDNPYYLLTDTPSATARFLGRAERSAPSGSNQVFVRAMEPRFGV